MRVSHPVVSCFSLFLKAANMRGFRFPLDFLIPLPLQQPVSSPTLYGEVILQFSRQVLQPKVILPALALIILLFDLDDALDMDDEIFAVEEDDMQDDA